MGLPFALIVLVVATAAVWFGSGLLESAADRLATRYRLPPAVQGTVIAAVASSFPELSTAVVSTWIHGEFELGMSAIVGSAIFNILVIPALSGLSAGKLEFDLKLVYKDAQFYLTSIAVLLLTFSFALIYNPVGEEGFEGRATRVMVLLPLAVYALYLFLQQQDSGDYRAEGRAPSGAAAQVKAGREWLRLAGGLLVTLAGVEGLVRGSLALGRIFEVPSFFWGLTVIAAATSVPDAFVSIRAARRSSGGEVSLGNVLGSNVFDLLVAVPAGVMVAGATTVNFAVAAPLMGFLTIATVVLFAAMRIGLSLGRKECWFFLFLYVGFLGWVVLEATGVTQLTTG